MTKSKRILSEKAKAFLKEKPSYYTRRAGISFYECPMYGDEMYVIGIYPNGKVLSTGFYGVPDTDEAQWLLQEELEHDEKEEYEIEGDYCS